MKRYTIVTLCTVEAFSIVRGRVRWERLAASCEVCGCDIHTGRRTAESDRELADRLAGARAELIDAELPCANCGKLYDVKEARE